MTREAVLVDNETIGGAWACKMNKGAGGLIRAVKVKATMIKVCLQHARLLICCMAG